MTPSNNGDAQGVPDEAGWDTEWGPAPNFLREPSLPRATEPAAEPGDPPLATHDPLPADGVAGWDREWGPAPDFLLAPASGPSLAPLVDHGYPPRSSLRDDVEKATEALLAAKDLLDTLRDISRRQDLEAYA